MNGLNLTVRYVRITPPNIIRRRMPDGTVVTLKYPPELKKVMAIPIDWTDDPLEMTCGYAISPNFQPSQIVHGTAV